MSRPNPLRKAAYAIPVAALSFLLLSAGMCQPADEAPSTEAAPAAEEATTTLAAAEQQARAAAEAEERQRLAAIAAAEQELAEREARLAEEQERLAEEQARIRREGQLQAERERLAAERAAAAERERQLAERERELREREILLASGPEPTTEEVLAEEPAAPEPLPEPTGSYEGDFNEPWRQSQEPVDGPETVPAGEAGASDSEMVERELVLPAKEQVSVRAGERLEVQMADTLSSATAAVGDIVSSRLVEDLRNETGTLVVPAGAEVRGRVTQAVPYRRGGGGQATLAVEFTEIVVSPEQTVGIRASFAELGADRQKNRKKVVAGAVVGAILGHILGGDGSKNVIVGAAAGAAAGGAVVASSKERDAEIPGGQLITLQLEEVVTVEIEYGAVVPR